MPVSVSPEQFTFVNFDAATIETLLTRLLDRLGLASFTLRVVVNEASPIVRVVIQEGDPVVLHADSGAFEDPRRPRALSEDNTVTNAGRVLLRRQDRIDGSFADAPGDDDLTLAQMAAWDTYSVGRIGRLGYRVHAPRWRYNFRNRHGFNDVTDVAFDRLWAADGLTWAELSEISDGASASKVA